jgi:hypothetical protein
MYSSSGNAKIERSITELVRLSALNCISMQQSSVNLTSLVPVGTSLVGNGSILTSLFGQNLWCHTGCQTHFKIVKFLWQTKFWSKQLLLCYLYSISSSKSKKKREKNFRYSNKHRKLKWLSVVLNLIYFIPLFFNSKILTSGQYYIKRCPYTFWILNYWNFSYSILFAYIFKRY